VKIHQRPCPPGQEARSLVFDGLKQSLRNLNFIYLLVIFFIGLGIFNAVTTGLKISSGPECSPAPRPASPAANGAGRW